MSSPKVEIVKIEQLEDSELIHYVVTSKIIEEVTTISPVKKWYWLWLNWPDSKTKRFYKTITSETLKALRLVEHKVHKYRSYPDLENSIPEQYFLSESETFSYKSHIEYILEEAFTNLKLKEKYVKGTINKQPIEIFKSTPPKKCAYCLNELEKIATTCLETNLSYHVECHKESIAIAVNST